MHIVINSIETYSEQSSKRLRRGIEKFEAEAWLDLYASASEKIQKDLGLKVIPLEYSFAAIIPSVDIIALNRIIGLGLNKPFGKTTLEELKNILIENNVKRFFVQLHPDAQPDNSYELLEGSSFIYYNNWIKFHRYNSPSHKFNTGFLIKEIDKPEADIFAKILLHNFGWPDVLHPWIAGTVGRNHWKHYIAYDGSIPVATAMLFVKGNYAWLGFGSTLPEYRGKGIQSALLAKRIEDCRELGVKELILETADDKPGIHSVSKRNAVRAGFEITYIRPNFLYKTE
ncbi:MAG: GNAT family N-acetyltransferase [Ignavibacteriaceae bacterium]